MNIIARYCISINFISEMLGKIIHFFKKILQTSKKEVKPLEVAKACIGQNASKGSINRYLHYLDDAGVISVTYQEKSNGQKSNPLWSALPKIDNITGIWFPYHKDGCSASCSILIARLNVTFYKPKGD